MRTLGGPINLERQHYHHITNLHLGNPHAHPHYTMYLGGSPPLTAIFHFHDNYTAAARANDTRQASTTTTLQFSILIYTSATYNTRHAYKGGALDWTLLSCLPSLGATSGAWSV